MDIECYGNMFGGLGWAAVVGRCFWCKKREGTVRDRIFTRGNIDNTLGVFSRKILQENKRVWYKRTYYRKRHDIYERYIDNILGVFSRKFLQENKRVRYERTYYRKGHGIYESMFLYTIYYYSPIISF